MLTDVVSCLSGSKQYSASIAFTLALFSHLVNHVNIRLQAELEEADSQVPPLPTGASGEGTRRGGTEDLLGRRPPSVLEETETSLVVKHQASWEVFATRFVGSWKTGKSPGI